MGNATITVVVPCYNVENYLPRCLDSLKAQTFTDFEVLMVEDCSTDGTKEIVKNYARENGNFRAIYNKNNGGLGNARNVGIEAVESEYILFLDSDDWVPENYLQEMLEVLKSQKADISVCDIYLRYDDPEKDQRIVSYSNQPNKFGLINTGMAASSCNKLFKRKLFNDIQYPVNMVNEDIPVVLALMSKHKVAYAPNTFFNYYQRTGSIQNSKITNKRLDTIKAVALLRDNLGNDFDPKIWQAVIWHQVLAIYLYVIPKARGVFYRAGLIKEFNHLARENDINIDNNIGLDEFKKIRKINKYYADLCIKWLTQRKYVSISILMGLYHTYTDNKLVRALTLAIRRPRTFAKIVLKKYGFKHCVIKKDVQIDDLVYAAQKQNLIEETEMAVSVVVPNYNYERYLLQRVYSILYQSRKIKEILILDDCSSDNSVKLAEEIKSKIDKYVPIILINNEKNQGTFRQWENGFNNSASRYVWIAEADDYCSNKFLQYALGPFSQNNNVVISYVNTGYVDKNGLLLGNVKSDIDYQNSGHWNKDYINNGLDEARNYSYLNNTIANVSSVVFYKKEGIDYKKVFAEARDYRQAGDWVLYVNYMIHGHVAYTDKILNYYRVHGGNVSSTTKAQDHLREISTIYKLFDKKLGLSKQQRKKMESRIKFLEKVWKVK